MLHLFVCIYAHDGSIGLWESTPQDMGPFQHYILREESERERERERETDRERDMDRDRELESFHVLV